MDPGCAHPHPGPLPQAGEGAGSVRLDRRWRALRSRTRFAGSLFPRSAGWVREDGTPVGRVKMAQIPSPRTAGRGQGEGRLRIATGQVATPRHSLPPHNCEWKTKARLPPADPRFPLPALNRTDACDGADPLSPH